MIAMICEKAYECKVPAEYCEMKEPHEYHPTCGKIRTCIHTDWVIVCEQYEKGA